MRLRRELQTVAVPVFQFGVFSETDLTFYAGDNFNFGGRVQTNGNLFLSERGGHHADLLGSRHGVQRGRPRESVERPGSRRRRLHRQRRRARRDRLDSARNLAATRGRASPACRGGQALTPTTEPELDDDFDRVRPTRACSATA